MKKLYIVIGVPMLVVAMIFGGIGYMVGSNNGTSDGYQHGYSDGHNQGYTQGHSDGYTQGNSDGFNTGYSTAGGGIQNWFSQNCFNYPFLLLDTSQYVACHRY